MCHDLNKQVAPSLCSSCSLFIHGSISAPQSIWYSWTLRVQQALPGYTFLAGTACSYPSGIQLYRHCWSFQIPTSCLTSSHLALSCRLRSLNNVASSIFSWVSSWVLATRRACFLKWDKPWPLETPWKPRGPAQTCWTMWPHFPKQPTVTSDKVAATIPRSDPPQSPGPFWWRQDLYHWLQNLISVCH